MTATSTDTKASTDTKPSTDGRAATRASGAAPTTNSPGRNEVHLSGRLAAGAEERELPSGDHIVTLRVVVPRAPAAIRKRQAAPATKRVTVDTIDVVCWTAATRRAALRLRADELVEVEGALRRRFFGGPSGRQSRYEVEASALRRASGGGAGGT